MKNKLLLTAVLLVSVSFVFAQGQGNFWFFGNNAALDFNSGSPVALTTGALYTQEGCASISTSAGALLFYTDGITVYNRLNIAMPNGFGLMGDPSASQSAIIVPKPGSSSIYYIFTVAAVGGSNGLRYSEVDMTLAGGLGDVTSLKNVPIHTPVSEKVTAVKQANNQDYWVISHQWGGNVYLVYSVTSAGVNLTASTYATGTSDGASDGVGYMKINSQSNKMVNVWDYINTVDVLSFNTTTGALTNDFTFTPSFTLPYGAEFSPDGRRLYLASESSLDILQFNMTLPTSAAIIASSTVIGSAASGFGYGALQLAVDGKIYGTKWSQGDLSCIANPNGLGTSCNYTDVAVPLAGFNGQGGLPNIIQSFFNAPGITFINTCVTDSTYFSLTDTTGVDSVFWNFDNPATGLADTSTLFHPFHIFTGPGTYTVNAITYGATLIPPVDTVTVVVNIVAPPTIALGNDTALCSGVSLVLTPTGGSGSYLWSTTSTNPSITVNSPGTYFVTVTAQCGTDSDTILVGALATPTVLVTDDTVCLGGLATFTASGASSYTWSSGVTVTGTNTATASPNTTTSYTVTGSTSGCTDTDIATVVIAPTPTPQISANITSGCAPLCIQFNELAGTNCDSVTYFFGDGAAGDDSDPLHCYANPGNYNVQISCKSFGCWGTTYYNGLIHVDTTPVAHFTISPSSIVSPNTAVTFVNSTYGGSFYSWNFDDPSSGLSNTSLLNSPGHTYATEGNYCVKLIVVNTGGCSDSISECLDVVNDIVVPNVFTPNGDGRNDLFEIKDLQLGIASLKIYDRWGIKIYESSAYNNDWSGGSATDGVYYYIMDYPPLSKNYTGFIELLKN